MTRYRSSVTWCARSHGPRGNGDFPMNTPIYRAFSTAMFDDTRELYPRFKSWICFIKRGEQMWSQSLSWQLFCGPNSDPSCDDLWPIQNKSVLDDSRPITWLYLLNCWVHVGYRYSIHRWNYTNKHDCATLPCKRWWVVILLTIW